MPSELLKHLMEQARDVRLVLPDFQRDFVWKPIDVIKLLSSLLNGYPIGGLLVMENPGVYGQRALDGVIPPKGQKNKGDHPLSIGWSATFDLMLSCVLQQYGCREISRAVLL
jgi:uncharacterized protein with ParB-like and HNH nuclease domain